MSTHCTISLIQSDPELVIKTITVQYNGFMNYMVPLLLNFYNYEHIVNLLVDAGNAEIIRQYLYNDPTGNYDICQFYNEKAQIFNSFSEFDKSIDTLYNYMFYNKKWYLYKNNFLVELNSYKICDDKKVYEDENNN